MNLPDTVSYNCPKTLNNMPSIFKQMRLISKNAIYQIVTHANLIGLQIKITCHNLHLHIFPFITFSFTLNLINLLLHTLP